MQDEKGKNSATDQQESKTDKQDLTITVVAPRSPESKTFTWRKTTRVGDAAKEAATAFGYQAGTPGFQTSGEPPRVLDNNKPLVAEHVRDGDELEIVDTGGGV
jgi:hypothetical protein